MEVETFFFTNSRNTYVSPIEIPLNNKSIPCLGSIIGIASAAGGQICGEGGHCGPEGGGPDGGGPCDGVGGGPGNNPIFGPGGPGDPGGRFVVNTVGIVKLGVIDVGLTVNGNGAIGNWIGAGNGSV